MTTKKQKQNKKGTGEPGFGLEGMWMKKIAFEWWAQDRVRGRDFSVPSDLGRCYAISLRRTDSFWIGSRQLLGPRSNGRNAALELYLQPRSAPLWFAQPARPRQGATCNFARTAARIRLQASPLQLLPSKAASLRLLPVLLLTSRSFRRLFFW